MLMSCIEPILQHPSFSKQTILKIMKVIYIPNYYVLCRTKVCTKLYLKVKHVQVWHLLIKHSLNTILVGYLYEMQMFIKGF